MFAPFLGFVFALLLAESLDPGESPRSRGALLAATTATTLLPHVLVWLAALSGRARSPLPAWRNLLERIYGACLIVLFAAQLWFFHWSEASREILRLAPASAWTRIALAPFRLGLLLSPLLASWILSIRVRRTLLGIEAAPGETLREIVLRLRQLATLAIPYLVLQVLGGEAAAGAEEALAPYRQRYLALWGLCALCATALYAASPLLIAPFWRTEEIPPGTLRDRLDAFARRMGLAPERIRIGLTSGTILNACGVGLLRRWQFIVVSDALAERFDPAQVEAIVAHEAGHLQRRHFAIYLLYGITCLAALLVLERHLGPADPATPHSALALACAAALAWLACLRFIGRRLEVQADLFAA